MAKSAPAETPRTPQATPTQRPWTFDEESFTVRAATKEAFRDSRQMADYRGCIVADLKEGIGCDNIPVAEFTARDFAIPEARANAELIVRAVNSHEQLVALLEKTAKYLRCVGTNDQNDTCGVTFTCPNCIGRREIEVALTAAKGVR